jgi:nucleotide-binding universal stress UspA family protein
MKKILLAIDDKKCAAQAVEYVGRQFGGTADVEVTLVHVLPNLPAIFWDEGHILSEEEKKERQKVVDTWAGRQRQKVEPLMRSAADALVRQGFKAGQITTRFVADSTDIADSLLEEARDGGYQTIVAGRCGIAQGKHLIMGSVTSRILHKASGVAVCVVM